MLPFVFSPAYAEIHYRFRYFFSWLKKREPEILADVPYRFYLPKSSQVTLTVYDVLGKKVKTLIDRRLAAGAQQIIFNGSRLASGIYWYRLNAGGNISTRKMILLK